MAFNFRFYPERPKSSINEWDTWSMEYSIKSVCVVGLGYIGLPTAATLASRGIDVLGVDIYPKVIEAINSDHAWKITSHRRTAAC
jgi:UDP-N-acetyl-D-mannosaminuronate dehydrogenase